MGGGVKSKKDILRGRGGYVGWFMAMTSQEMILIKVAKMYIQIISYRSK